MPCHTSSPRRGNTPNLTPFCLVIVLLWLSNVVEQYIIGTLHQHPSPNEPRSFVSVSVRPQVLWCSCLPPGVLCTLACLRGFGGRKCRGNVGVCDHLSQLHPGQTIQLSPSRTTATAAYSTLNLAHIALDFITGLPDSEVNTVFLMVVDCFSKSVHFRHFGSAVVRLQSVDQWSDWEDQSKPGDRPPLHVQAEHTSRSRLLPWIEYAHNSLPFTSTGLSSFEVCFGYQPLLFSSRETLVPSAQAFVCQCNLT